MFITFVISFLIGFSLLWFCANIFLKNRDYKKDLSKEIKAYICWHQEFVWLDFESFKSIFELSPDSWRLGGHYVNNLKLVNIDTGRECIVAFKKRKDYIKATTLFDKYKKEKEKRLLSKKEIEDFNFFKEMVQLDIDKKKKEAEQEIEKANELLNKLNRYKENEKKRI